MRGQWPVLLMSRELDTGGCERDLAKIALALDRSRFEPHVACFHEGMRANELRAAGIPVLRLPVRSLLTPSALHGALLMGRYLQRNHIQLVHAFDVPMDIFGVPVAAAFRVPAIIASQLSYRAMCGPFTRQALRIADGLAQKVVVNSKAVERSLIAGEGLSRGDVYLCHNGVDTREFHPGPASRPSALDGASLVIGSVCVLRPEKQLHLLLEAFARVRRLRPGMMLLIVGSGPELERLERLRDQLDLAAECHFTPATPDVAQWMRSMDIFVLASSIESFPNALLEAMACGCAVIGSRVGGVPELVADGMNGSLFEPGNVDELASRLAELVNDPERRMAFGANAAQTAHENFSIEIAVRRMEALYTSLLSAAT